MSRESLNRKSSNSGIDERYPQMIHLEKLDYETDPQIHIGMI